MKNNSVRGFVSRRRVRYLPALQPERGFVTGACKAAACETLHGRRAT